MSKTGSGIWTILRKYFLYIIQSRHWKGHGIHSPYVFEMVSSFYSSKKDPILKELYRYHKGLYQRKDNLCIKDHGAGSRVTKEECRTVGSMARKSSIRFKYAILLYRLCRWYKPASIIEFGSGLGISSRYLAKAGGGKKVLSMEGSIEKCNFAKEEALRDGIEEIEFLYGRFDDLLPGIVSAIQEKTFVFLDGDHRYEPTMKNVDFLLKEAKGREMMIVLDDIYWSDGMERAWKEVCADSRVAISMDVFQFGILILRDGIEKQHFKVKF